MRLNLEEGLEGASVANDNRAVGQTRASRGRNAGSASLTSDDGREGIPNDGPASWKFGLFPGQKSSLCYSLSFTHFVSIEAFSTTGGSVVDKTTIARNAIRDAIFT